MWSDYQAESDMDYIKKELALNNPCTMTPVQSVAHFFFLAA
jgi:hypothetical protein